MNYEESSNYISRFDDENPGAVDTYHAAEVTAQNGRMHYSDAQGMKDHHAKIWKFMREIPSVQRFVSDGETMTVELREHFDVRKDKENSPLGEIKRGEMFDKVSHLDLVKTALDGTQISLGIVH